MPRERGWRERPNRTRLVLLATGPICAAVVGALINLLTNGWDWVLFGVLAVLVGFTATLAIAVDGGHHGEARTRGPDAEPVPRPRINTLPRDVDDFTGRDRELQRLVDAIEHPGSALQIHSVDGMGGVGKTTLVLHAAHITAGRYPDASLFINLQGHAQGQDPITPYDALGILLSDLGLPGERIPDHFEGRVTLWRRELSGVRAMIILDNASDPDQVRDLLPGGQECLVLITSRRRMVELEALSSSLSLEMLRPEDAITLFERIIGAERAASKHAEMARIIGRVGFLPLAIRLTAARLRAHPTWTVDDLLDSGIGRNRTLEQVYTLSYRDLDEQHKHFFRLLSVHPGAEVTPDTAAVLTGTGHEEALIMLEEIYNRHLIEEPVHYRYRFHDLIKGLASREGVEVGSSPERQEALMRLLGYYAAVADECSLRIGNHDRVPLIKPVTELPHDPPADEVGALDWFDQEIGNLLVCAHYASEKSLMPFAWQIPSAITSFLRLRGLLAQAQAVLDNALNALRLAPDGVGEASIRRRLGHVARLRGDYRLARTYLDIALRSAIGLADRQGEAWCRHELAHLDRLTGDVPAACGHLTRALKLHIETGNELGEAASRTNLGMALMQNGDTERARAEFRKARHIASARGDRRGEAFASYQLGALERSASHYELARSYLDSALKIYDSVRNGHGQADCHYHLAKVDRMIGAYQSGRRHLADALSIYLSLGYRRGEADTYAESAEIARADGDTVMATMYSARAEALYAELNL